MARLRSHRLSTEDLDRCRHLGLVIDEAFERGITSTPERRRLGIRRALAVIAFVLVVAGVAAMDLRFARAVNPPVKAPHGRTGGSRKPEHHALPSRPL